MSNILPTIIFACNALSIPLMTEPNIGSVILFLANIIMMAWFAGSIFEDYQ